MNERERQARPRGGEDDGIVDLLRETMDGLGRLIGEHVKLAKLELVADARQLGRQLGMMVVAVPVLALGYVLCCLAGAVALGRVVGLPQGLLIVGGAHVVVGFVAVLVAVSRGRRRSRLLDETVWEAKATLASIKAQASGAPRLPG